MNKKIYCTSTNGELFGSIEYETKEEAMADTGKYLDNGD
jgi:hypothetical protein